MSIKVGSKEVADAWAKVKNDSGGENWLLLGYDPKDQKALNVVGSGKGGYDEFVGQLAEDLVLYGVFRVYAVDDDSKRVKFVQVTWVGPKVKVVQRGGRIPWEERKISRVIMMAARGVRVATHKALQVQAARANTQRLIASSTRVLAVVPSLEEVHGNRSILPVALVAAAGVAAAAASLGHDEARCDAKLSTPPSGAPLVSEEDVPKPAKSSGRRHLLKSRTRHKAKLEEVDLMKIHLDEYKKTRAAIDSLSTRFEMYASKTVQKQPDGPSVAAMTFTDFVHSIILPRFHTRLPHADVEYTCDFVGNADGLITYEECYLLIHLLQIPKEHFDVAFCMFDLDGDGAVDKDEFCHVIENLLRAITASDDTKPPLTISAEETLPRLTRYLFGRFGKNQIRASDLEAALDVLRKEVLKAEFDLYAKPHPTQKGVSVISVHDFAITLLSCFDADRLPPYLERVERLNASDELVTWDDFYKFHFHVQNHVADIKLAFELTGTEEITEADFIHAAHVVTGVELPFSVVQLAFRVFDGNDNGTLDRSELMKVLEMRTNIDLQQRRPDSKFKRFWQCAKGHKE